MAERIVISSIRKVDQAATQVHRSMVEYLSIFDHFCFVNYIKLHTPRVEFFSVDDFYMVSLLNTDNGSVDSFSADSILSWSVHFDGFGGKISRVLRWLGFENKAEIEDVEHVKE